MDLASEQCSSKDDCDRLTSRGETYVCKDRLCQRETCADAKDGDAFCRGRAGELGSSFATAICDTDPKAKSKSCLPGQCESTDECDDGRVCDTKLKSCVALGASVCASGKDEDCAKYDGLPLCVSQKCVAKECSVDKDCRAKSDTATCTRGKCVDELWGCLDEPVPVLESGTVTYETTVVHALSSEMPASLEAKLCGEIDDQDCVNPPAGATVELDFATNTLRVKDFPRNKHVHLQLRADADGIIPHDLWSQQRLVDDLVVVPKPVYMIPAALLPAFSGALDTKADGVNNSTFIAGLFDCHGQPAAGVAISTDKMIENPVDNANTRVFYVVEGNKPDLERLDSDSYGVAGIINVPPNQTVKVTAQRGNHKMSAYQFPAKPNWIMLVTMYPHGDEPLE